VVEALEAALIWASGLHNLLPATKPRTGCRRRENHGRHLCMMCASVAAIIPSANVSKRNASGCWRSALIVLSQDVYRAALDAAMKEKGLKKQLPPPQPDRYPDHREACPWTQVICGIYMAARSRSDALDNDDDHVG